MTRRLLIAGNWKMNGTRTQLAELEALSTSVAAGDTVNVDVAICPPATLLSPARAVLPAAVALGGQDCHPLQSGAHTGDISAEMLQDCGATFVILGHSERRTDHGESDALVRAKTIAAWRAGLTPIVCIGETESERDTGATLNVLADQLTGSLPDETASHRIVIAYEPVWAIGSGRTPTLDQVSEVHAFLRGELAKRFGDSFAEGVRILYGGSMKPANAGELLALRDVDGGLVGGASLKASDFVAICKAAPAA